VAKDVQGFPFHDILFEWLEKDVMLVFSQTLSSKLTAEKIDPASYIGAISEVIITASHSQELPKPFEDCLKSLLDLIQKIVEKLLERGESQKLMGYAPQILAKAIKSQIDEGGKSMPQQGSYSSSVNKILGIINNVISASPS